MMNSYYEHGGATLYHGDCREVLPYLRDWADVLVTDPPYGIAYKSGRPRATVSDSISGDQDTSLRDYVLQWWGSRPALVFGTWRIPRPYGTRALLIWDTKGALGMGDLSIPWKPSHQEIYVLGSGFTGRRDSDVITCAPVQSLGYNGREHPHEKPVALLARLIDKCPHPFGTVLDPFAGVGSTLIAARDAGRRAIGIELDERYCEIAARRLDQGSLFAEGVE
jgi:DNA modification methylase